MRRWWRSHSVRVQLTLWYVAAMTLVLGVYAGAILGYVSRSASQALDQQLRTDFQLASAMVEQTPDGGIIWSGEENLEIVRPWLQVLDEKGDILYRDEGAPDIPFDSQALLKLPDDTIVSIPTAGGVPVRILSRRGRITSRPVIIQVARSEADMRQQVRGIALILLFGLPLAVATAGFGGYLLAGRALAPAEASYERMRRFTADVSHELRTPLTAIRSVGEVGLRGRKDEGEYRAIIGSMLEEVDRLAVLVDRLLTLSRAETGQARLAIESIDLKELADAVVTDLAVLAEEKSQQIVVEAHGAPRGLGDRLMIRQALINLVDNAIKFAPAGTAVVIRVDDAQGRVVVDVIDRGPGIPESARAHIFDRFYRAAGAAETSGTGLGLSISKSAVETAGGTLTLDRSDDHGSTFRITLPRG